MTGKETENSPRRHGDHGDDFVFPEKHSFGFTLGALCVSVVKTCTKQSQLAKERAAWAKAHPTGRRVLTVETHAKQTQFQRPPVGCRERAMRNKANLASGDARPTRGHRAKQSQLAQGLP